MMAPRAFPDLCLTAECVFFVCVFFLKWYFVYTFPDMYGGVAKVWPEVFAPHTQKKPPPPLLDC